MTRAEIAATLAAIEQQLADRVDLVRVIITPDGTVLKRVYRCSFSMPADWKPPTLEHLIATAKKGRARG